MSRLAVVLLFAGALFFEADHPWVGIIAGGVCAGAALVEMFRPGLVEHWLTGRPMFRKAIKPTSCWPTR